MRRKTTGMRDKNEKMMREGDVVIFARACYQDIGTAIIYYNQEDCRFYAKTTDDNINYGLNNRYEIINDKI
jgi:hypothetical protein